MVILTSSTSSVPVASHIPGSGHCTPMVTWFSWALANPLTSEAGKLNLQGAVHETVHPGTGVVVVVVVGTVVVVDVVVATVVVVRGRVVVVLRGGAASLTTSELTAEDPP